MNYLALLVGTYLAMAGQNQLPPVNVTEWQSYKLEHGKSYENDNIESMRRTIYAHNKQKIHEFHTTQEEAQSFSLKLNHFADSSQVEMMALNGFKLPNEVEARRGMLLNSPHADQFVQSILDDDSIEVPDSLDWRTVPGRVSNVKNQGQCGSCWAFASTGALEGQENPRANLTGDKSQVVELSEQNLVDCVKEDYGCQGGFMKDAFEFIKSEGGIDDEKSYPYEGATKKCRFNKDKVAFSDAGAAILPTGDEQKLKEVVAKFGPVAVAIDAGSIWFQFYHKGVYYNKHCHNKQEELDHGVLVVGYGTDPKKGDYWLVKNSWGPHWGENGYIKMARNKNNNCGIATVATIPTF